MQQRRILHVCALNAGGIESFVMNVYRELDKEKFIFDFINYFDSEKEQFYEKEVLKYGSKVYKSGSMNYKNPFLRHIKKIKYLYKFLKSNKYSVIHIHASDSISIEDAIIAKLAGVPKIIVHSHNTSVDKRSKLYKIKYIFHCMTKWIWNYVATDYLACSKVAAEWMFPKKIINNNEFIIINNAIEVKKYIYNEEVRLRIRKEMNLENKFVIGHVGRMTHQKNHEFLIEVFKEINNKHKDTVLLLIGKGELEEKIREKVKQLQIEDNVIFYGLSKEVNNLLQVMDVFALPSHYEGLPVVGIEAQASGLKVLVSENVSRQMRITDNVKYLSVENNVDAWCNEICKYIGGYDRKDMTEEINDAGYGAENVSKELEKIYLCGLNGV